MINKTLTFLVFGASVLMMSCGVERTTIKNKDYEIVKQAFDNSSLNFEIVKVYDQKPAWQGIGLLFYQISIKRIDFESIVLNNKYLRIPYGLVENSRELPYDAILSFKFHFELSLCSEAYVADRPFGNLIGDNAKELSYIIVSQANGDQLIINVKLDERYLR